MLDYDLVVIGSTPEGIYAAMTASALTARVALVSQNCSPQATSWPLRRLEKMGDILQQETLSHWGMTGEEKGLKWDNAIASLRDTITALNENTSPAILSALGIDWINGVGEFCRKPKQAFVVEGRKLRSRSYLLATGASVTPPPEYAQWGYTIEQLWSEEKLTRLPQNIMIIGGTPFALEVAQSLNRLGKQVTLATPKKLLPQEDSEAIKLIQAQLEAEGVKIYTQSPVTQVKQLDPQIWVQAGDFAIAAEEIIWANPPQANVAGLNLEGVGVTPQQGKILVNPKLQTSNRRIYACGALLGGYNLPHLAQYEVSVILKNALYLPLFSANYHGLPWAIFTDPNLAQVGLLPHQARKRYGDKVCIYRQQFKHNPQAAMMGKFNGFCKLVVHRNGDILGATVVGYQAAEVINILALALQNRVKLAQLLHFPQLSPTLSEIIFQTVLEWQRDRNRAKTWLNRLRDRWLLWQRNIINN